MSRGKFITLEGGEGAGKSTQARLLSTALEARGINCVITREPGGSPGAEEIRELLVKGEPDRWSAVTEALLMTASRADHVERVIVPAIERGDWVICDRFFDSTVAYQGGGGGLGPAKIMELQRWALGDLSPDLTLIFDLPVEAGLSRATDREAESGQGEDRFERVGNEFHQRLRLAYLDIADREPDRCKLVNAGEAIDKVEQQIWALVSVLLEDGHADD